MKSLLRWVTSWTCFGFHGLSCGSLRHEVVLVPWVGWKTSWSHLENLHRGPCWRGTTRSLL